MAIVPCSSKPVGLAWFLRTTGPDAFVFSTWVRQIPLPLVASTLATNGPTAAGAALRVHLLGTVEPSR